MPNVDTDALLPFADQKGGLQKISRRDIMGLAIDKQGRLWAVTYCGGLILYDGRRWYVFREAAGIDENLFTVFIDDRSQLFVGSERRGMYMTDLSAFQPDSPVFRRVSHDPNDPYALSSNHVRTIFKDRRGNLWIGCFRAGVNLQPARRKRFEGFAYEQNNPKSIGNNLINVILEDIRPFVIFLLQPTIGRLPIR